MRYSVLAVAGACLFSSNGAAAQNTVDWSGFYAGILTNVSAGEMANEFGYSSQTHGAMVNALVGYRFSIGDAIGGVEGQIGFGSIGFSKRETFGPWATFDNNYYLYPALSLTGSIGLPSGKFLPFLFAGAGVAGAEFQERLVTSLLPPGAPVLTGADFDGKALHLSLSAGVGVDMQLAGHLLLRGQYTFTKLVRARYSDPASGWVDISAGIHSIGAGLLYQF